MATVYSLICFGGKDGKTVTFTDAGDVVNLTNHGLRDGTGVVFTDNGNTLPTGLTKGTTYYAKQGADANKFTLWTDATLTTQVTFSGTGSGTHKIKSAYYVGLTDKSRWTYGGTEYIFDSLSNWNTHRTSTVPANAFDEEVAELATANYEHLSTYLNITIPCSVVRITASIDGVRTDAFHGGVLDAGYVVVRNTANNTATTGIPFRGVFDGFTIKHTNSGYNPTAIVVSSLAVARYMVVIGTYSSSARGFSITSPFATAEYCVAVNCGYGFFFTYGQAGLNAYNCIAAKNIVGFYGEGTTNYGEKYNNISINNGTNWSGATTGITASNNIGQSNGSGGYTGGTPWYSGSNPYTSMLSSDMASFGGASWAATDNYAPATSSSPQVDYGIEYYGIRSYDIAGTEVPSYNNGGSEGVDAGAFEYDLGYGPHPQSQTVTVSGYVSGSRVSINKQSDGTEIYNSDSPNWPQTTGYAVSTDVYVYIRKASSATYYHPVRLAGTIDPDTGLTLNASGLQVEDIAADTYAAGVATDWSIDWDTGAITHSSGTTRYTVQDLYSCHQDLSDTSTNIVKLPKMHGTTNRIFELINDGDITDADLEDLTGGSIEFQDGTLWSNLWTTDTMAAAHPVYIVQGASKYTSFWADGSIDVLLKVSNAGTLIDSGLVTAYARPYGYTYSQYEADLSGGGRSVAPLLTTVDATCQAIDPSGFTDITVTFGSTSKDFGDGEGAQTYYCVIDCNNRPLSEVYARMMYLCRDVSTSTLNGVEGWRYAKAHSSYPANTSAPFGSYIGGLWTVAKGVWLDNVRGLDYLDYILTDHAGGTHQNVSSDLATGLVSGLVAGSRIQIYNVTTATEMYNDIVSGTSYSTEYENGTGYTNGDTIRVRCAWMSGTSAKLPVQYTTIATTAGWSVLASQEDDEIYNANGIDGDTVTEFAADYPNVQIDINDLDGATTPQRGYAWYISGQMTADGIRYYHGAMTAEDAGNYRINVDINDMHIQNVSTSPVYITGARLYRSDGTRVTVAGSGPIEMEYGRVFTTTVTLSGESVVTGTAAEIIAAIPSTTANAAAVLAAAQVTPIHSDMRKTVGTTLKGDGTEADKFRSVLVD